VVALYVALPPLGATLLAGLGVAAAQSALRQSDPTVSVVPRLLAAGAAALLFGAWMAGTLTGFWIDLWAALPQLVR